MSILARQTLGSNGRKVSGQNRSGLLCRDHVCLLVPPSPWTKMMSALWPLFGVYTTLRLMGPVLVFVVSGLRSVFAELEDSPLLDVVVPRNGGW